MHDPDKASVVFTPVFHVTGFFGALLNICAGNSAVIMPRFHLEEYLGNLKKYHVSYYHHFNQKWNVGTMRLSCHLGIA